MDNIQTISIVTPSTRLVIYGATHEKPKFEKFTHEFINSTTHEKPKFEKCTHEFIKGMFHLKVAHNSWRPSVLRS